jgi:hypothetical protein
VSTFFVTGKGLICKSISTLVPFVADLVSEEVICTGFGTRVLFAAVALVLFAAVALVLFAAVALVLFNVFEVCKKPKPESINIGMKTSIAKEKQIIKQIIPIFLLIIKDKDNYLINLTISDPVKFFLI